MPPGRSDGEAACYFDVPLVLEPLELGEVVELDECGVELEPLPIEEPDELGELDELESLSIDEEPLVPDELGELEELDGEELDPLIPDEPLLLGELDELLLGELDEPEMPLLELLGDVVLLDDPLRPEPELPELCSIVELPLDRFMSLSELLEPANTAVPKVRATIETVVNNRRFMRRSSAVAIGRAPPDERGDGPTGSTRRPCPDLPQTTSDPLNSSLA